MSCYSFKITKGNMELSVCSEDKYFVLMQFNRLYEQLVGKVKVEKQEKTGKSVKKENDEKTTKKSGSKKVKSEMMSTKDATRSLEKTVESVPESQPPVAVPEKADIIPEQEAAPEKETETKQIVMPAELEQEPTPTEIDEDAEKQEEIAFSTVEMPEEEDKASDVKPENETASLEEIFSKEQETEATGTEEIMANDVVEPINEDEPEETTVETELQEAKEPETVEKTGNLDDDDIEIPDDTTEEDISGESENSSDFEKIMSKKLMEELDPFEEEAQEEDDDEGPEADIFDDDEEDDDEEVEEDDEEDDEELKETITYYANGKDSSESTEPKPEEEEELAQELNNTFETEEPVVETKKNKIYDILQQKLSSLPKAELSRLNLFKFKEPEPQPETAKLEKLPSFKSFDDLIYLKKPQTKLDYLLITSYYLQENEAKEKYSLKQINARVIPVLKEAIDHSVIHEAVAHSYLQVVPDIGDGADVTEYAITPEGIDYILNEL